MSGYWHAPDDYEYAPEQRSGSAHSVSNDAEPDDPAEAVRKIAEEVTGKTISRPAPRRIGF